MRSASRAIRDLLGGLAALNLIAAVAVAGPPSELVIFGDSLSDVGNIDQVTTGSIFIPDFPGPYYFDGRFSNGPVYVEALAAGLGLPPITHSLAGGNNFAYGGAQTTGTGGLNGFVIDDVDEQVSDFLNSFAVDPDALFVIFAGANDLIGGQTNLNIPIGSLADDVLELIEAGARQFLVPNLPLLGHTPRFNGNPATASQYNSITAQFNSGLAAMLDELEADNAAVKIFRFDVAGLFDQALAMPSDFGLTNVTDAAAPGLTPGTLFYDTGRIADQPNEYLFWDDLHPTAAVHALLAERALALLLALPGDYNGDGTVDAADYSLWRDRLGTDFDLGGNGDETGASAGVVDQVDYDLWVAHFGETAITGSGVTGHLAPGESRGANAAVPEPAASVSFVVTAFLLALFGRCRDR